MMAPCNPTRVVKTHKKQKKRRQRRPPLSTSATGSSQTVDAADSDNIAFPTEPGDGFLDAGATMAMALPADGQQDE